MARTSVERLAGSVGVLQWPSSRVSDPGERDQSELSDDFAPWEVGMQPDEAANAYCAQPASTDASATVTMSFFMDGPSSVWLTRQE